MVGCFLKWKLRMARESAVNRHQDNSTSLFDVILTMRRR